MILSILTYLILALALYALAQNYVISNNLYLERYGQSPRFFMPQIWLSLLIFGLICGLRYNVGVDNLVYIKFYSFVLNEANAFNEHFEPLFLLITRLFSYSGFHWSVWLGFWGVIQIGFTYYSVKDYRFLLPYLALFIVLGPTFLSWTNGLRQCVVICIFYWAIQFAVQKRYIVYSCIVLGCLFIHKSAVLLLPMYFLYQYPWVPSKKYVQLIFVIVCTIIGLTPTWLDIMNNIKPLLDSIDYKSYADNLERISKSNDIMGWGPARIGIWLLDIMTIWVYSILNSQYKFPKLFNVFFFSFFWGICAFNLFSNTSHIFLRPIAYLRDFRLLIVPICLYYLKKDNQERTLFLMSCLAYFYTLYGTIKAYTDNGLGDNSPEVYKFFFLQ